MHPLPLAEASFTGTTQQVTRARGRMSLRQGVVEILPSATQLLGQSSGYGGLATAAQTDQSNAP